MLATNKYRLYWKRRFAFRSKYFRVCVLTCLEMPTFEKIVACICYLGYLYLLLIINNFAQLFFITVIYAIFRINGSYILITLVRKDFTVAEWDGSSKIDWISVDNVAEGQLTTQTRLATSNDTMIKHEGKSEANSCIEYRAIEAESEKRTRGEWKCEGLASRR